MKLLFIALFCLLTANVAWSEEGAKTDAKDAKTDTKTDTKTDATTDATTDAKKDAKKDTMTAEYLSEDSFPTHGVTIAGALKALGITYEKIDHLKLVGDESSGTIGLSREIKIDDWFWERYFETAEPYKYWVPSGNRRLEVYLKGETKPKTTIYINETDRCSADGDPRKLTYMCHGLHSWFMANIHTETKKAEQAVPPNGP